MADIVDRANEQAEYLLQVALQRRQVQTVPGAAECDACGIEILESRRRLLPSTRLCVECAHVHESKVRRGKL
ncbi:TraR/DksA C4-type zinc finger protein [Pseudomonas oryzihabitans]|uniref:TraR/DksA C4-type zinc finger protein n=1 Tax=Pseudomonas oryzihabitans TaxID=47885 RepID=UPI0035E3BEC4